MRLSSGELEALELKAFLTVILSTCYQFTGICKLRKICPGLYVIIVSAWLLLSVSHYMSGELC